MSTQSLFVSDRHSVRKKVTPTGLEAGYDVTGKPHWVKVGVHSDCFGSHQPSSDPWCCQFWFSKYCRAVARSTRLARRWFTAHVSTHAEPSHHCCMITAKRTSVPSELCITGVHCSSTQQPHKCGALALLALEAPPRLRHVQKNGMQSHDARRHANSAQQQQIRPLHCVLQAQGFTTVGQDLSCPVCGQKKGERRASAAATNGRFVTARTWQRWIDWAPLNHRPIVAMRSTVTKANTCEPCKPLHVAS